MEKVYLSLGTNLGNRAENLKMAIKLLGENGVKIVNKSNIYETEPLHVKDQPEFLNMVVEGECECEVEELLRICQKIEKEMGRERDEKSGGGSVQRYGPRIIDIDILFYGKWQIESDLLKVPHERMSERRFVLQPLNEIAAKLVHPGLLKSVGELLGECNDESKVCLVEGNVDEGQGVKKAGESAESQGCGDDQECGGCCGCGGCK